MDYGLAFLVGVWCVNSVIIAFCLGSIAVKLAKGTWG